MVVAGRKDFVQLSSEVLERGGVLRFRALGGSMHPFIKNGEILRVKPVESADVDCGDVVFYWTRGRGVVAHRLIRKKRLNGEDIFVMKGDSVPVFDELVRAEQVIGKVIAIERNGRVRELESTPHRVLNRVLALVSPFSRRIYLALWMPRRAVVFVARPCVGLLQGQALFRRFVRRAVGGGIDVRSATDEDESTFGLGLARSADALSAEIGPEARLGGRPGVPGQDVYRFIAVRKHVLIGQLFLVHSQVSAENGGDGPYGGWWIYALTVRARFRGAGVGRRLTELAVAEAKARGALDVRLTVFQADRAARTLYEKVGFEKFFSPELKKELDGAVAHGQKRRIAMIKEGLQSPKTDRVSSSKLGRQRLRMHAVETTDLTKKYFPPSGLMRLMAKSPVKETLTAVDKVSLNINQGELFALLGPNGAGKTTLIKMLCTLLLPTSGSATVNGHDLVKDEDNVRASIGFVSSEERSFYWRLTGRQNLEFFATLLSMPKITAAARIQEVLDQLGLTDAADNMCYSYSSGMKQKLVIARGLLADPAVLIMDEPTKSVDAITGQRLKKFVKEELVEKEGRTVIMTTHRLEEAEQLADRLAVMNKGRLLFQGTLEELKDITGEKASYRMRISGLESDSLIRFAEGQGLADVKVAPADSDQNMRFTFTNGRAPLGAIVDGISKAGGTLKSCARDDLKLEDIFVALVEGDAEKVGGNGA